MVRRMIWIGVCGLLAAGWGLSSHGLAESLEVCVRPNTPFFTTEEGLQAGLERDILAAFAEDRGLSLSFRRPQTFKTMLDEVVAGTCQLAAGTITVTEPRRQMMDFSPSYFPVRIVVVEPAGSASTRLEQFHGKRAATIPGSTYLGAIEKIGGVELVWTESSRQMFQAVSEGRADFLACDSAIVLAMIDEYPELVVSVPLSDRDELAFALPKGSELSEPLTRFMENLKNSNRYREILLRYFDAEGVDLILKDPPIGARLNRSSRE